MEVDVWKSHRKYLAELLGVSTSDISDADIAAYARPRVNWPPQGKLPEFYSSNSIKFPPEDDMHPDSILVPAQLPAQQSYYDLSRSS